MSTAAAPAPAPGTPATTQPQTPPASPGQTMEERVRTWTMVALTGIFVILYALTLFGFVPQTTNAGVLDRLEPIIFVIIGYYFGRLPGEKNEQSLKQEIDRQTNRADTADSRRHDSDQQAATANTKLDAAAAALDPAADGAPPAQLPTILSGRSSQPAAPDASVRESARAALRILKS